MLDTKYYQESRQMDDMRFADVMRRERERLNHERDEILEQQKELENQQKELEDKLTEVTRELAAIDAYEAAKTGKAAMPAQQPPAPEKSEATIEELSAEPRPRPQPGTRREALLRVIGEHPNGLSRGEIFKYMGLKGDKFAEKSVSNALTALTKNNLVSRREGKYVIGKRQVDASTSGDPITNEQHAELRSKEGSA
jgi:DNA-binding transcriptional ArsR family regulator